MSSLSNQHSSNPFSEYSELCKVPTMATTGPPPPWDWQDMGAPQAVTGTGLTDEDKLCFFEQPGVNAGLKVPSQMGGVTGMSTSPSLGNASLGSAGESPDSLSSCSPSPGQMSSQCGGSSPSMMTRAMQESPTEGISPSESWDNTDFPQSSPKVAMPQVASKYCMESSGNVLTEAESPIADRVVEGSTRDNSEEEDMEDEEEEDLEPCFMGRAQIQRKAMRRAMSECTHLSVPASLDLSDKYPGGGGDTSDLLLASPLAAGGPRRSPHSMKRSLTLAEDQPPTPPPVLSAAGTAHLDLRQPPPEPRLRLSPLPPLKDHVSTPIQPFSGGLQVEKELGGIILPVPPSPRAFDGFLSLNTVDLNNSRDKPSHETGLDFLSQNKATDWHESDFANKGYSSITMSTNTNPFITMKGRWRNT